MIYKNIEISGDDTIENRVLLVEAYLRSNGVDSPTQAQVDAGLIDLDNWLKEKQALREAKEFLQDNPQAKALIELPAAGLLTAIDNRTAAQETLLLKTLAMMARVWFAERQ